MTAHLPWRLKLEVGVGHEVSKEDCSFPDLRWKTMEAEDGDQTGVCS